MKKYGLISKYTMKQYKLHSTKCNEDKIANIVKRKTASLAIKAFSSIHRPLNEINILHTDR